MSRPTKITVRSPTGEVLSCVVRYTAAKDFRAIHTNLKDLTPAEKAARLNDLRRDRAYRETWLQTASDEELTSKLNGRNYGPRRIVYIDGRNSLVAERIEEELARRKSNHA